MKNTFGFISLSLFLFACAGQPAPKKKAPSWSSHMQATAQALKDLIPYLYDDNRFEDPKNNRAIQEKIKSFSKSVHTIDNLRAQQILGNDPYILSSLTNLKDLTSRSEHFFNRGDKKTSQILLKATTQSCFKCHTRQNMGPQNMSWDGFEMKNLEIHPVEKAHLFISLRRFEDAKKYIKDFLQNSEASKDFDIHYENALHYYLMISLRGQNGVQESLDFVRQKIVIPGIPTTLHYTLKHWERDLTYWVANQKNLQNDLKSAKKVLSRNSKKNTDRHLINDLIASQLLHQYLGKNLNSKQTAQAYFLLGQVYDELVLEGFWNLPENYYEQCIQFYPKSGVAKTCFQKLRDNIVFGYSGSRGTLIPKMEYQRMEKLRKKAGL